MNLPEQDAAAIERVENIYLSLSARHEPNIACQLTMAVLTLSQQPRAAGKPYTIKEAADKLQLTPQTVYDLCKDRLIKAVNLRPAGKRPSYRITEEALAEYLRENQRAKPAATPSHFKHLRPLKQSA